MSNYRRRCRGQTCRAEIALLPTEAGKRLPIDVDPHPDGNVAVTRDLLGEPVAVVLGATAAARWRAEGRSLYMPHHATCPDVEAFR